MLYASGQPFRGWRMPSEEVLHFLTAPWPRYITLEDLLLNIGAYVPLGFLLTLALRPRLRAQRAVLATIALGIAVSVAMEYMQTLLPGRISSNVDVLTNGIGTILGALAAPLFAPTRHLGQRLLALRARWFLPGFRADAGLIIVCLWLLTALHPTAQLFGTGDLRATLDLPAWFLHQPHISVIAEAAVVSLNLLGLGLLIAGLAQPGAGTARFVFLAVAGAIAIKAGTAAGLKPGSQWSWLTPGVSLGLVLGATLLYGAARLPARAQAWGGALSILLAVTVINITPGNPYQTLPPQFLAGNASHFLSYSGITRALSEIWPLLAVLYLALQRKPRFGTAPAPARDRL